MRDVPGRREKGRTGKGKGMKKGLQLILLLGLLMWTGSARGAGADRYLTVMVYLCGSDLESGYGSATRDLEEIAGACAGNREVTVLAMIGGSRQWLGENCGPEETRILEIGARGKRRVLSDPGGKNMGEAESLSAFLKFGAERYPASEYALILWDHGGGPLEGVCFDERFGMDSLSLAELETALADSPFSMDRRLAWIGFDACLMASLETAGSCKDYAEYMIASQETEPEAGWNYSFLSRIARGDSPESMGRDIVRSYTAGKKESDMLTLSLIDLRQIADLERSADLFFRKIGSGLTAETFPGISRKRQGTRSFGRSSTGSEYDLVDLHNLAGSYADEAPEEAADLRENLGRAVLLTAGNQENASGLSVFFPYYNKQRYLSGWQEIVRDFDFLAGYRSFINRYSEVWTGTPMVRFTGLKGEAFLAEDGRTQKTELTLTEEQAAHFAEASCTVLAQWGSETQFRNLCTMPEPVLEGNRLTADYSFEALYAVDENGEALTEPIPFLIQDGYYLIHAYLETHSMLDPAENAEYLGVNLLCRRDESTGAVEILNVSPNSEEGQLNFGRQSVDLTDGKWRFLFLNAVLPFEMTRDGEGSLLPFDQWKTGSRAAQLNIAAIDEAGNRISPIRDMTSSVKTETVGKTREEYEVDLSRPWRLQFLPLRSPDRRLYAQFTVRDTQGNEWGSELIPLASPGILASAPLQAEKTEFPGGWMLPLELRAVRCDEYTGLYLLTRIRNEAERELWVFAVDLVLNGRVCPEIALIPDWIVPAGEECFAGFRIPLDGMHFPENTVIREISFLPWTTALGMEEDPDPWPERIRLTTELDLSGLELPREESREPLAGIRSSGPVLFELTRLEEPEGGILAGTMRVENTGETSQRVKFRKNITGTTPSFGINDALILDGVRIKNHLFLLPGTEEYADFEILPTKDRRIRVTADGSEAWERTVRQVLLCGFLIVREEGLRSGMEPAPEQYAEDEVIFGLREPLFLKTPFREVFTPAEAEEPGTESGTGE